MLLQLVFKDAKISFIETEIVFINKERTEVKYYQKGFMVGIEIEIDDLLKAFVNGECVIDNTK